MPGIDTAKLQIAVHPHVVILSWCDCIDSAGPRLVRVVGIR